VSKFCGECGAGLVQGSKFCGDCGAAIPEPKNEKSEKSTNEPTAPLPVAPTPEAVSPDAPVTTAEAEKPRRGKALWIAAAAVVVVLLAGGGLVLALSSGGDEVATPKRPPGTTTTTLDAAKLKTYQDLGAYVDKIENILTQSSSGRGQVGRLVSGVQNGCQISPYDASAQIRTVVDNRTSILSQLAALSTAPTPESQNFASLLQQSLQSSIEADNQYKAWMDYLYTDYYYTYPVGCPGGVPPTNEAFDAARTADGNSTRLKQQFVDAFNGIASFYGKQTWSGSDF
jgi:hypothetical protein